MKKPKKDYTQKKLIQTIRDDGGKLLDKIEYKKLFCKNCNKPINKTGGGGNYTFFKCECCEWVADDTMPLEGNPNWSTLRKRTNELRTINDGD